MKISLFFRADLTGSIRTFSAASTFVPTGSRWDGDVKQFREQAHTDILKMIEANKNKGMKVLKVEKKIQGGC